MQAKERISEGQRHPSQYQERHIRGWLIGAQVLRGGVGGRVLIDEAPRVPEASQGGDWRSAPPPPTPRFRQGCKGRDSVEISRTFSQQW